MVERGVAVEREGLPGVAEPTWPKALTLAERVALPGPIVDAADESRVHRRLRRWKQAHDLEESGALATLLATVPGGEDGLVSLLGEPAAALASRAGPPPDWWLALQAALAQPPVVSSSAHSALAHVSSDHPDQEDWRHGFALSMAPFMRRAVTELANRLRTDAVRHSIAVQPVLSMFMAALNGSLVSVAARTLILELNVLRVRGGLAGQTPQDRFADFVRHITSRAGQDALFDEYPVLGRLLVQRADAAADAAWEMFQRWGADRDSVVANLFAHSDPGQVTSVSFGLGDGHQGGRSVAVLGFANGARVVYKPRPLGVHVRVNELLRWLDATMDGLGLRTLRVVDRGGHGWLEFAEHAGCATTTQVRDYYRRLGAQLALLYAIDGADFHFENLIACADQPVLVDLEAVFHQVQPPVPGTARAEDPAIRLLDSSVMRVGLLPMMVSSPKGSVDLSGLGGDPAAAAPFASAAWDDGGLDTMRVVRRHLEFPGGHNRPSVRGVSATLSQFVDPLIVGFREAYRAIASHADELIGPDGLLAGFADIEVRTVLRATQTYATLLHEGTHPDLLRDALDRERHLSFLWSAAAGDPGLNAITPYELADLWAGDIPLFTSRPGSRDLWTSHGHRLADFFDQSGLARVRAKVASLDETDLGRQEWIIRAALVTRPNAGAMALADRAPTDDRTPMGGFAASDGAYLAAARVIGDRLDRLAVRGQDRAAWLGLELTDDNSWRVSALRWDLYSGSAGVALFLSYLADLTGESGYRDLGRQALWSVAAVVDGLAAMPVDRLAAMPRLGGFAGLPGLAYALVHLGRHDPALLELVHRSIPLIAGLVPGDETHDVLSGSAGAMGAMLAIHAATGHADALEVARQCGEHLLARAVPTGAGVAWPTLRDASRPLTGFSHGAAGIGWALVRLGSALDDQRFIDHGLAAFAYERGEFRVDLANWPDYRTGPDYGAGSAVDPDRHMYAWCHGAAGIGLARADVLAVVDDPALRDDLTTALAGTVEHGFGRDHSLCHGDLGNAELLLADRAAGALAPVGGRILASLGQDGPRCGTPNLVETPGLMTGLAGIGYGLLRLAAPDRVPSVLLLAPPPSGHS